MKNYKFFLAILLCLFMVVGCSKPAPKTDEQSNVQSEKTTDAKDTASNETSSDWNEILEKAKGKTVNFYGWGGDDKRNEWIDSYLIPIMKDKYDVTVNRVGMDIDEINNLLLAEKNSDKDGNVDVVWINGENFANAKKNDFLYGPFTQKLPNFNDYIDAESSDVKFDFGEPVEGMEAPYGKAQFVFLYDSAKIKTPPTNHEEFLELAKENPGKITYAALPDFTGSVFVRNIISDIQGYEDFMDKNLTKEQLEGMLEPSMNYLKELSGYLWNNGESYPPDNPTLENMFADGEVLLAMSYNPNTASMLIAQGKFPDTVKTFVFDKGNIGNTHFLAIGKKSPNKEAAMVMINEILSPEAQISKADPNVLGDLPVVDYDKLTDEQKKSYDAIPSGESTLPQKELAEKRIPEMPAQLVPLIEEIWEEKVLH